jgi:hypothetical protein
MIGAILLLSIYTLMACTGTLLLLQLEGNFIILTDKFIYCLLVYGFLTIPTVAPITASDGSMVNKIK